MEKDKILKNQIRPPKSDERFPSDQMMMGRRFADKMVGFEPSDMSEFLPQLYSGVDRPCFCYFIIGVKRDIEKGKRLKNQIRPQKCGKRCRHTKGWWRDGVQTKWSVWGHLMYQSFYLDSILEWSNHVSATSLSELAGTWRETKSTFIESAVKDLVDFCNDSSFVIDVGSIPKQSGLASVTSLSEQAEIWKKIKE